jgi:hypothetical protein
MADPLESLAARAEGEPFFLAPLLSAYARSEGLDEAGLAARLGCRPADLNLLRLCRAPRPERREFWEDVTCIAGHFGMASERLAEAVKRARVVARLQTVLPPQPAPADADSAGFLMAARDRETEPPPDDPEEKP